MTTDSTITLCDCYTSDEGTIQCMRPNGVGCPYEAFRQTAPLMTPNVLESLASESHGVTMTTTDTRTPAEVDRSIAELMGWVQCTAQHSSPEMAANCWAYADSPDSGGTLPDFYHDLNALRDGPEAKLREAGWLLEIQVEADGSTLATWWKRTSIDSEYEVRANTEAAARARAAEAALKAMQEAK